MKYLSRLIIIFILFPSVSFAGSGKEFTTSVIYGTLAGTLVGAATLAFTSSPGDNLGNVARGASYGLYAGILLGLYVTYGIDDSQGDTKQEEAPAPSAPPEDKLPIGPGSPPDSPGGGPQGSLQLKHHDQAPLYGMSLYPIINSQRGHDVGIGVSLLNYHF